MRQSNSQSPLKRGNNHLVIIGIDQYTHVAKLDNAVRDAQSVRDVLLEKYCFEPPFLHEFYNEQATRKALINGLKSLIQPIQAEDSLIIYFSGHGHYDEEIEEGYLIPVKAEMEEIDTYISYDFLQKVIKKIKARHVLLIVDSCYSGAIIERNRNMKPKERLEARKSRWLIASGRNEVVKDGPPGGNSPFAKQLLQELRAYQGDGLRTMSLAERLVGEVSYQVAQTPVGVPLGDFGDKGGEFIFYLKESDDAENAWRTIEQSKQITDFEDFLNRFGIRHVVAQQAIQRIKELEEEEEKVWKACTQPIFSKSKTYLKRKNNYSTLKIWNQVPRFQGRIYYAIYFLLKSPVEFHLPFKKNSPQGTLQTPTGNISLNV